MIEGIPVEDDKPTPLSEKFSDLTRSNIKLLGIASINGNNHVISIFTGLDN